MFRHRIQLNDIFPLVERSIYLSDFAGRLVPQTLMFPEQVVGDNPPIKVSLSGLRILKSA